MDVSASDSACEERSGRSCRTFSAAVLFGGTLSYIKKKKKKKKSAGRLATER